MAVQQQTNVSGARRKVTKGNYGVFGLIIVLLAIGAFFLGNMGVEKATVFKEEMQALENRRNQAVSDKEEYARKIQNLQSAMQMVQQKAAMWKQAERVISKPYALSALAWMEARAKDQRPQLTTTNTNPDDTKKPGAITMQVSGDFKSLLSWIIESEHELDAIRIVKANWKAKTSQAVELNLNIEVDNNE